MARSVSRRTIGSSSVLGASWLAGLLASFKWYSRTLSSRSSRTHCLELDGASGLHVLVPRYFQLVSSADCWLLRKSFSSSVNTVKETIAECCLIKCDGKEQRITAWGPTQVSVQIWQRFVSCGPQYKAWWWTPSSGGGGWHADWIGIIVKLEDEEQERQSGTKWTSEDNKEVDAQHTAPPIEEFAAAGGQGQRRRRGGGQLNVQLIKDEHERVRSISSILIKSD